MPSVELVEEVETIVEAAPVPAPPPSGKLILEIDVADVKIEDMQAIDRMGAPEAGAFANAVDVMARMVTNIDIRKRHLKELKAISKAIMAQIKEETNPGN